MNRSSDAHPVKNLGPMPYARKPLGSATLPTVYLASNLGAVAIVRQESGGTTRMTIDQAERAGYLTVIRETDNNYGVVSALTIQIKSSRLRSTAFIPPSARVPRT